MEAKVDIKRVQIEEQKKSNPVKCGEIIALIGNYRYMMLSDVFPSKRINFEGYSFWEPNNPENILKHFYNDWMKLPKSEDRVPHYNQVVFYE